MEAGSARPAYRRHTALSAWLYSTRVAIGPWVALVLLGLPRLVQVLRTFSKPRPESPPHSYVGWPLWFVGGAFIHTRRAGGLLVLGLLLNVLLPIRLPWG